MDDTRFDRLATDLARGLGRRRLLGAIGLGGAAAALGLAGPTTDEAEAEWQGRRHGKHDRGHGRSGKGDRAAAPAKKCKGGKTKCGKKCRDLSTDPAHCGTCGHACDTGQTCSAGTCASVGCGSGERPCGEGCIPDVANACCADIDCGEPGDHNAIHCDHERQACVCDDPTLGICQRYDDGRGRCAACCPGASPANCQGDHACRGDDFCTCPPGQASCNARQCYVDWRNGGGDAGAATKCGPSCTDCTHDGADPYVCCWRGECQPANGYGPNIPGSYGTFCGDCTRCAETAMCCNLGPGTPPDCREGVATCPVVD